MSEVTAKINRGPDDPFTQNLSRSLARSASAESGLGVDFSAGRTIFERPADYYVRIFNISQQAFPVNQPLFKNRTLPACPTGEPYIEVACFPNIVVERFVAADTGQIHPNEYAGERVAMDLISPSNPGIDMDTVLSADALSSGGSSTDLIKRGLFFIRGYDTPTDEDLKRARSRMEKWYRQLIAEANQLSRIGKQNDITAEMHLAGDYFKIKDGWHTVAERPETCANCGDDVKPGVAYHRTAEGMICVRDWQRTVAAGIKTKKEVPEDLRWWTEDSKGK